MKKNIALLGGLLASAMAVAANVESANTFGVMKIDVGAGTNEVVIAVPWVAVGDGTLSVTVSNLLNTASLASGDELYAYDDTNNKYAKWTWNGTTWNDPTTFVNGDKVSAAKADVVTLARGKGFILKRNSATEAASYYISGQYSGAATNVTITAASNGVYGWTLIAPPTAAEFDINNGITWTGNIHSNDVIIVGLGTQYTRNDANTAWQKYSGLNATTHFKEYTTTGVTIPAGRGAWYRRASEESLTLTWPANN